MQITDLDEALLKSAFDLAAKDGWSTVTVAAAAREAGVALDEARERFPGRASILVTLGRMADRHALGDALADGETRERLFDVLMRRIDVLQQHRGGVLALLRAMPADPGLALLLAATTRASMGWMLEASGVPAHGLAGSLRTHGLVAVWLYTIRAWQTDETQDLSATMAALDRALQRAEQAAGWLNGAAARQPTPKPFPEVDGGLADRAPLEEPEADQPVVDEL